MKLGIVTYQIAHAWDVPTILERCTATGFEGVELRTTHAHGVEVELSAAERVDVRTQFADGGVAIAGLGSAFEYHSTDPDEVRRNIAGTNEYVRLAHDVGSPGVKVRPNGLPEGVPAEKTLEQIGKSLAECGAFAQDHGVEIRVEVHGRATQLPANMRAIMDACDSPNVRVCWNSNPTDVTDGSIDDSLALLGEDIGLVHITELSNEAYPYGDLFRYLKQSGYEGFCLAEIPASEEPERLMRYYRALLNALQP